MKYLFILGRNIELSIAELRSFFEKEGIGFRQIGLSGNGLLAETKERFHEGTVNRLGGTVSIGEVLAEGNLREISEEIDRKEIYNVRNNKLSYLFFDFSGKDFEDLSAFLKQKFKREKLKATEKKVSGRIKMQDGDSVPNSPSRHVDEQYFAFWNCFGRVIEKSDYKKIEERDMNKPVRRNELSISPRLAKILINLSGVKANQTLLDPFCGIGVVLEEALFQNIKVIGIDKDLEAIESAKKNLEWFGFGKEKYRLISLDSSKARIPPSGGIATEPDLGELQKGTPSEEGAKKTIRNFEELMVKVLRNLKGSVGGRIVFTAPYILAGRKRIGCSPERISKETGLKILGGPINEFRENQIVGRQVFVMG